MATADSNDNKIICTINKNGKNIIINLGPKLPSNVNNKWPAIIFAVNRIVKVIGRIKLLIDSIKIIKGISKFGVPWGTKWINILLVVLIHP